MIMTCDDMMMMIIDQTVMVKWWVICVDMSMMISDTVSDDMSIMISVTCVALLCSSADLPRKSVSVFSLQVNISPASSGVSSIRTWAIKYLRLALIQWTRFANVIRRSSRRRTPSFTYIDAGQYLTSMCQWGYPFSMERLSIALYPALTRPYCEPTWTIRIIKIFHETMISTWWRAW